MSKYTKNAKGYYRKKVFIGISEDGKRMYKDITGKTIKELERKVDEYKDSIEKGIDPEKRYTFAEMSQLWLDGLNDDSPNTKRQYEAMLRNEINPYFGRKQVKDLRIGDFDGLITNLLEKGKKGYSYLCKIKIICNGVMNKAYDNRLVTNNPFLNARIPTRETLKGKRECISEQQEQALREHWKKHKMGMGALIMLDCGLRRGELLALKWSDIDFEKKTLHVRNSVRFEGNRPIEKDGGKTESAVRDIPMPDSLVRELSSVEKDSLSYVLHGEKHINKPMTQTGFRRAWNGLMTLLNIESGGTYKTRWKEAVVIIPPFTPHQLRHTYQTRLFFEYGVDIKSSQYYLGHSDISTTLETYTHFDKNKVSENMNKFLRNEQKAVEKKVVAIG